jgi:hypothetical protein
MSNDTYLAIFLGSKTSPKMIAWNSLPDAERRAKEREGIAALPPSRILIFRERLMLRSLGLSC